MVVLLVQDIDARARVGHHGQWRACYLDFKHGLSVLTAFYAIHVDLEDFVVVAVFLIKSVDCRLSTPRGAFWLLLFVRLLSRVFALHADGLEVVEFPARSACLAVCWAGSLASLVWIFSSTIVTSIAGISVRAGVATLLRLLIVAFGGPAQKAADLLLILLERLRLSVCQLHGFSSI